VQLIKLITEQKNDFKMDDFKDFLGIIEESAVRCKKITQALLDFSHASKTHLQVISLNESIEKVTALILHELSLQNIVIKKELGIDLPRVKGDAQLLEQVILDLIVNARWAIQKKNKQDGGTITIVTSYDTKEDKIKVDVSDTGIGIPKENLDKIFEPFFTTKDVGEGTGLGLSLVYSIIVNLGGTIVAESQVGKGTTFKICFPVSKGNI
jgi:two-component system NtrC family sensor kinase